MPYLATWTNGDAQGRVAPAVHRIRLSDAQELAEAINRRRLLTYQAAQDFSSHVAAGKRLREPTFDSAVAPPLDNFRAALAEKILSAPLGTLGGEPATPAAMDWLWPIADGDENKRIVAGEAGAGEVSLFDKLNATAGWTDADLLAAVSPVRAVHCNELRQAVEWLRRGRWVLPVYLATGLFSPLPDTPWIGELIANNGAQELRTLGMAILRTVDDPPRGLCGVMARESCSLAVTADADCQVEVYRCKRTVDFVTDRPTWNEYDPSASAAWASPGGAGADDAAWIGSVSLTAGVPGYLTGAALAEAVQAMVDGAEQNFLLRRADTGYETITLTAELTVEFDLDSPPN